MVWHEHSWPIMVGQCANCRKSRAAALRCSMLGDGAPVPRVALVRAVIAGTAAVPRGMASLDRQVAAGNY